MNTQIYISQATMKANQMERDYLISEVDREFTRITECVKNHGIYREETRQYTPSISRRACIIQLATIQKLKAAGYDAELREIPDDELGPSEKSYLLIGIKKDQIMGNTYYLEVKNGESADENDNN